MRPISRRDALLLGGLGTAATVAGGAGLWWSLASTQQPTGGTLPAQGSGLHGPPELRSADGRLRSPLTPPPGRWSSAAAGPAPSATTAPSPGPTLRLRPGDELAVRLVNSLDEPTNLHVHGLHVSPQANGDNVFVEVRPGEAFDYSYRLPPDHPPGVYWYHPHHHGTVAGQIFAGLFGAIIVEDPEAIPVSRERVLLVSDTTLDSAGNIAAVSPMERMAGREGELLLLNGQSTPLLTARPGERETVADRQRLRGPLCPAPAGRPAAAVAGHGLGPVPRSGDRQRTPAGAGQPCGPAGDGRRRRIDPAGPPL